MPRSGDDPVFTDPVDVALDVVLALLGLVVLVRAADVFVRGAAAVSSRLQVPPIVVGAVVIGLGTSVPELLVSVFAAVDGNAELGVGNVIGSNIANLSLVLGVAALLTPVMASSTTLRREAPLSFLAVTAFGVVVWVGLPLVGGVLLLCAVVVVLVMAVRTRAEPSDAELIEEVRAVESRWDALSTTRLGLLTTLGLVGTAVGAQMVVTGATGVAAATGLADGLVGLTLVALGTSLPELVTAVQATRRGEDELVMGNVLGSNMFNSLLAGGLVAVLAPGPIDDRLLATRGVAVMVAVAALGWVAISRGRHISRPVAALLLAGYGVAVVVTT